MVSPQPLLSDVDREASLEARRRAIVAAFRAARAELPAPGREPLAAAGAAVTEAAPAGRAAPAEPAPAAPSPADPQPVDPRVDALTAEVRRLAERVERLEDTVELAGGRDDDEPLRWPAAVGDESELAVPPLEVSRRGSPAFDVLLGPSR